MVLFTRAHNVVFFFSLGKKKINFEYLIASSVDVGANSVGGGRTRHGARPTGSELRSFRPWGPFLKAPGNYQAR